MKYSTVARLANTRGRVSATHNEAVAESAETPADNRRTTSNGYPVDTTYSNIVRPSESNESTSAPRPIKYSTVARLANTRGRVSSTHNEAVATSFVPTLVAAGVAVGIGVGAGTGIAVGSGVAVGTAVAVGEGTVGGAGVAVGVFVGVGTTRTCSLAAAIASLIAK